MKWLPLPSFLVAGLTLATLQAAEPAQKPVEDLSRLPFRDANLPFEERVDDLVSRLTVEEKVRQMMMDSPPIPRLGIPGYHWWNEALHGVARNGVATVFPQAIGLAATWDPELHYKIADVISTEARAKNNELLRQRGDTKIYEGLTIWSPNINIFRDPRWGRGQETYGEDPFLTARFAVAFVRGLQGNDPRYFKTVATVKHYAVHSGPEELRHKFDAVVSEKDLHETYLPAFEAGIREGGAGSLMSAYNAINGVPAPANRLLLNDILRKDWGFRGAVVGDVDTVADVYRPGGHGYAKDAAEASAVSVKGGNDLCSGDTYQAIPEALKRGLLTESDLDQALRRLFLLRFKLGQFDPAERVPYRAIPFSENASAAHDQLALQAARESVVLLKNDGTLPWDLKKIKTVAVIGPTADDTSAMLGNYHGVPTQSVTLLQALRARLESAGVKVIHRVGCPLVAGFGETGQAIPAGVLFTDETKQTPGLRAEIFSDKSLSGPAIGQRTDTQLDLLWNEAQPVPGLPEKNVHARWSGVLIPRDSGNYTLSMSTIGAVKLLLDGQTLAENKSDPGEVRVGSNRMRLEAGRVYHIAIEYNQRGGEGKIALGWAPPGTPEESIDAAKSADQIVVALGVTPAIEGEEMPVSIEGFSHGDRTSVDLPQVQRELLDRVLAFGKPVTLVLTGGGAISFDPAKPNAALMLWYYGQRGGDALVDTLLGANNPSGRLPVTFYRTVADLPSFEDYAMKNRTYRYYTGTPLFPFGHGLSYSKFEYTKVTPSDTRITPAQSVQLKIDVRNVSDRDGDEVVQVYAHQVGAPPSEPIRRLVGFKRLHVARGQTSTVSIDVPAQQLRVWDESTHGYIVRPAQYELEIGASSGDRRLKSTIAVQ